MLNKADKSYIYLASTAGRVDVNDSSFLTHVDIERGDYTVDLEKKTGPIMLL